MGKVPADALPHARNAFSAGRSILPEDGLVVQFYDATGLMWWRDTGADGLDGTTRPTAPSLGLVKDEWRWASTSGVENALPSEDTRWGKTGPIPYAVAERLVSGGTATKAALCGSSA